MSFQFEAFIERFQLLRKSHQNFVIVTLSKVVGSAPQDLGARMIVTGKGLDWGTIGGGKIENFGLQKALEFLLKAPQPETRINEYLEINLQKDIGMSCGGVVGILLELVQVRPHWRIVVFGAGHVAQELIPLLVKLEVEVSCYDSRPEWLSKLPEAPNLTKFAVADLPRVIEQLSPESFIVCVTMGHATDLPILRQALPCDFPYVGAIGSEVKANRLRSDLKAAGLSSDHVQKLICPIGEGFGSNAPYEIALSIISQLLRVRDQIIAEIAPG
jgi:xanthine dehydrogenase accessory factor